MERYGVRLGELREVAARVLADVDRLLALLDRFEGSPAELMADGDTLTARHLRAYLGR